MNKRFSPKLPDRFWVPSNYLFNEYMGKFFRKLNSRDVKLTIYLHLIPRLQMSVALPPHLPQAVMASTGTRCCTLRNKCLEFLYTLQHLTRKPFLFS
jgi:hypothetical protein